MSRIIGSVLVLALILSTFASCMVPVEESTETKTETKTEATTETKTETETETESKTESKTEIKTESKADTEAKTEKETKEETEERSETEITVEAIIPTETLTNTSFFESIFFTVDPEKEEYINEDYAKYPRIQYQRMPALLSRNTALYKNINGQKVLADAYYCNKGEAYGTNEAALGLLLYNSIIYKIDNPDKDVSISFVSSDMSLETAVCVVYQSRYFGYVRNLEGEGSEYDRNGFIRISYMLIEAAKMGIDVEIVSLGAEDDFTLYVSGGLEQSCYDKYAKGKKVSDYLKLMTVNWAEEEAREALNITAITVSAYCDRFNTVYENATFLSGAGLVGVNESGERESSCSGVTISGHREIYVATKNFIGLLGQYADADSSDDFRKALSERNSAQAARFAEGKESRIPEEERIVWLGNKNDAVFKLVFSCGDGEGSARDLYSDTIESLAYSAEHYPNESRLLLINGSAEKGQALSAATAEAIGVAFVDNKNGENRISLTLKEYENVKLLTLNKSDIGYIDLNDSGAGSDETLLSYVDEGGRAYVTVISSPLAGVTADKSVDMMISVSENETIGDSFFMAIGNESDSECIKEEGLRFSSDEIIFQSQVLNTLPQTFEAVFEVNEAAASKNAYCGMLLSNYDNWGSLISYDIVSSGSPRVTFWINEFVPDPTRPKGDHYKITRLIFKFDQVDVRSYSEVHLAIVHDRENQQMLCYVNGELKQTLLQEDVLSEEQKLEGVAPLYDFPIHKSLVIGGNYAGGNGQHFRGVLKSLAIWADVRNAEEIRSDVNSPIDAGDSDLLSAYDFRGDRETAMKDLSSNGNDLESEILWQDVDEVDIPEDYAYSFALIGDIQVLSLRYFNDHYKGDKTLPNDPFDDVYVDEDINPRDNEIEYIDRIFSWLLDNKDEHKIEYVMTLGDLTEESWTAEWDYVKSQIYRLGGKIPFSLVPGNHDRRDPEVKEMTEYGYDIWPEERLLDSYFHKIFNDDVYRAQIDGSMDPRDVANTYKAFTVGDVDYLLLTLDYGASDSVLEWASDIVESYPDHRVIVTTHAYLFRDGSTVDAYDVYPATRIDGGSNDGDDIWEKFASKHENIVLVLSGHDPYDHIVYTKTEGENGNVVTQMLIDPQGIDAYMPVCSGMIAMLYFSEDGNTITVRYYSPVYNRFGSEKSQFTINLGE